MEMKLSILLLITVFVILQQESQAFRFGFNNVGHRVSKGKHAAVLSMAQSNVAMPALSSTMTSGKIVSWSKKVGDKVSSGDVLLVVESDKADMDVEAFEDGYLASIITPEGGTANVGDTVAIIVSDKSEIGSVGAVAQKAATPAAALAAATTAASTVTSGGGASRPAGCEGIMMPALSSTMTSGKIVSWGKKIGDKINSGDMVLVVESDKADMDVESYDEGYLAAIITPEGESANVGSPVAFLAKTKDDIPAVQAYAESLKGGASSAPAAPAAPPATTPPTTPSTPAAPPAAPAYVSASGATSATPVARRLASENNIDIKTIKGTGNFGRVLPDDVLKAAGKYVEPAPKTVKPTPSTTTTTAAAPTPAVAGSKSNAPAPVLDGVKPMDSMQKAVAKNMEKTLSVPIFRVSREIVTDKFDALYAQLKPKGVTVSAMLAKAVAEVLKKHPIVNAAYVEGGIKYNKDVNVAMAVAIDGGLITPTIIAAQNQDLFSISRTWKELVDKAKAKKLTPAEYSSGTFTISNLGMFGVQQFDAILPPDTGSILAIAASTPKVVQTKEGTLTVQKSMTVTITCDHRHIYGADAAEFLKDLADLLENNVMSLVMG